MTGTCHIIGESKGKQKRKHYERSELHF